jgi:hypothetical protein
MGRRDRCGAVRRTGLSIDQSGVRYGGKTSLRAGNAPLTPGPFQNEHTAFTCCEGMNVFSGITNYAPTYFSNA